MKKPGLLVRVYDRLAAVRLRLRAAAGIRRIRRLDQLPERERGRIVVSRRPVSQGSVLRHRSVTATPEEETLCTPDLELIVLKDVLVDAYFGVAITQDGRALEDTAIRRDPIERKMRDGAFFRPTHVVEVDRPVMLLDSGPKNNNFFHFWADSLTKLLWLDEPEVRALGPATLVHCRPLDDWQKALLRRALPSDSELLRVDRGARVAAPAFIALPSIRGSGVDFIPSQVELDALREWSQDLTSGSGQGPRIYVSRRRANHRRFLNEVELAALLRKHGFEEVVLEALPVPDQIDTFRSASAIVAAHGAGLVHLLHARPGTRLLEIHAGRPPGYPRHYRALAAATRVAYSNLFCGAEGHHIDAYVPLDEVEQWVDRLAQEDRTDRSDGLTGRS